MAMSKEIQERFDAIPIKDIKRILRRNYEVKQPVMLHGTMGIGKSSVIRQVAKEMGIAVKDIRLSQCDAVDLRGIPVLEGNDGNKITSWATPDFLPNVQRDGEKGILFLDELNLAATSVQHASLELILDRRIGGYTLPAGWVCFAAGNRTEDNAGINEMPAPLLNRFTHINFPTPTTKEWTDWAVENDVDYRVISYLNLRYKYLYTYNYDAKERAFATPRSWEFTSNMIKGIKSEGNEELLKYLVASCVGEGLAVEFVSYIKMTESFNIEEMLQTPKTCQIPNPTNAVDRCFALVSALAEKNKQDKYQQFKPSLILVERTNPEFTILFLRMVLAGKKKGNLPKPIDDCLLSVHEKYGKYLF